MRTITSAALCLLLLAGALPANAADQEIKIGVDLPVSGADAGSGIPTQNGAVLAIEDAGKMLPKGFKFTIVTLDDAVGGVHNPQQGASNMKQLAADPLVLGDVGPFNSSVAAAEIPITNGIDLAMVSPEVTNPSITLDGKYRTAHPTVANFFRVCSRDDLQGKADADYMKALHFKNIALIDDNETYGKGLADIVETQAKADGLTVVAHDHVTQGQQDFKALLTRIASKHPDVVYWGGVLSTGGGLIRQQMASAGMDPAKVAYFSADDFPLNDNYLKIAAGAAQNTYATGAYIDVRTTPDGRAFLNAYKARWHADPAGFSAAGYVAAQALTSGIIAAIKKNGGKLPNRLQVVQALHQLKLKSVLGTFAFDKNGDTTDPVVSLWAVKNNAWTYVKRSADK
jgi:branched-chain amino acid transport system substrate-binding protein